MLKTKKGTDFFLRNIFTSFCVRINLQLKRIKVERTTKLISTLDVIFLFIINFEINI